MNTYEEQQRGRNAAELLENPMFREAMDGLKASIVEKWRSCPIRDIDGQHELKLMDKLLTDIEKYLAEIVNTGKMASIQLERETKIAELRQRGVR